MKKYGVATAIKPHSTLRSSVIPDSPKRQCEMSKQGELVYQIPCQSCNSSYIGETGRLFKNRLEEHQKDVDSAPTSTSQPLLIMPPENHIIDWERAKVVDRESNKRERHVREAIWIWRTENMINRDNNNNNNKSFIYRW